MQALMLIVQRYPRLKKLSLSCCGFDMSIMAESFPDLTHCVLSDYNELRMTDAQFASFLASSKSLVYLHVSSCRKMSTNGTFMALAKHAEFGGKEVSILCTARKLEIVTIATLCPSLQSLTLRNYKLISDADIQFVVTKCPLHHTISLCGCKYNEKFTAVSVTAIVQHCVHLTNIAIDHMPDLTDDHLIELVSTYKMNC